MTKKPEKYFLWPGALLLIGAVIRFYNLDRTLGGGDENEFLLSWAYTPMSRILTDFSSGGHQVFHTILVRFMIIVFGEENEIAIRFPAFAFGIAGILMVYRTARILFADPGVAQIALILATFCPIHIYYSQTARGYSFIMFFSTAMVYCSVRFLESKKIFLWGSLLILSGFLSVYTILTNIYFAISLAVWMGLVLAFPKFSDEFGFGSEERGRWAWIVLVVFFCMGVITLIFYSSMLDEIVNAAKNYYMPRAAQDALHTIQAKSVHMLFRGYLIWFLPFFVLGFIFGKPIRKSYLLIPAVSLLTPFAVSWVTGWTGFPRNYLFHFPLVIIFTSAGIVITSEFFKKIMPEKTIIVFITGVFCITAIHYLVFRQFPKLKIADGREYKKIVQEFSKLHDLIIIPNSSNYLYAHILYKENLFRIFRHNRLTGIKMIASTENKVKNYSLNNGYRDILFKPIFNNRSYNLKELNGGRFLFNVSDFLTVGNFAEDFESSGKWIQVQGNGNIEIDTSQFLIGRKALLLKPGPKLDMVVQTPESPAIMFKNPALVALVWAGAMVGDRQESGHLIANPQITIREDGSIKRLNVITARVNQGIPFFLPKSGSRKFRWYLTAQLGVIPRGNYSIGITIGAAKGRNILYDGLRLFLIDWPYYKEKKNTGND